MVLDSCPAEVVQLGSEDRWFDKLVSGAPFVVLVDAEVEAGKRVRTASTIVRVSSLVKGGWTRLFFEGGVVVEAPFTSLSPEWVCLWLCWFLAGPLVHLFFLRGGIIDTKIILNWMTADTAVHNALRLSYMYLLHVLFTRANILINAFCDHLSISNKVTITQWPSI